MIKSNKLFLFVLFSFFAFQARDNEHKKCERKRSWTEVFLKTAAASALLAYAAPFCIKLAEPYLDSYELLSSLKGPKEEATKAIPKVAKKLPVFKEVVVDAALKVYDGLNKHHLYIPSYFLALATSQALTAVVFKPIFG